MANTFLGYEIASPERQRKTALAIIGVVCALVVGGMLALYFISRGSTGREQALATITAFETKCRYVVRNISRRASYYDHTGLIDCDRAHEVARANDSVLGSVQRVTVDVVDFTALDGSKIHSACRAQQKRALCDRREGRRSLSDRRSTRSQGACELPLGFGKKSIAPQPESHASSGKADIAAPAKPRPSEAFSKSTLLWIGLATMVVGILLAYWLIRGLLSRHTLACGPRRGDAARHACERRSGRTGATRARDEASRRGRLRPAFALKRDFGLARARVRVRIAGALAPIAHPATARRWVLGALATRSHAPVVTALALLDHRQHALRVRLRDWNPAHAPPPRSMRVPTAPRTMARERISRPFRLFRKMPL